LNKLHLAGLALFLLVVSFPLSSVFAQTRTAGVKAGDTFKYTYTLDFNMTNSSDFALPSVLDAVFAEAKAIDWMEVSVLSVSGSSVSARALLHFKNGTEQSSVNSMDVAYGSDNLTLFLVAANLNQNDLIYLGGGDERINETVSRSFSSGNRQVNHQSISMDYNVSEDELAGFNMSAGFVQHNVEDVFWDRQTGVLVEMSYAMMTRSPTFNADVSMKVSLLSSNVTTIPEFSVFSSVFLFVFASSVGLVVVWKTKKLARFG